MESESAESDVTKRITRTVVTRSYEASSGQSNIDGASSSDVVTIGGHVIGTGKAVYDVSNMTSDVVLMSSSSVSGGYTAIGLDRDLSNFKKRIDANTEEQREHAGLMAGLQRKVEDYRRRINDIESQISAQRPEERVTFNIKEGSETWTPEVAVVSADYEFSAQLEEERRRNDELRMQISQLQAEIQRLHQQYEMNMQDKDRMSANRERNLAQYLSEEQKRMMDLWAELQQVRRQFAEYRDQTARDLENQRNEFARVTRSVGGVVRKLSITNVAESAQAGDAELVDAIRRFSEQQALPAGTSTEDYNALMKKYEESIERIVELESRGDGSIGKMTALETELRRTKDKLAECQEALRKIHDVTKESERNTDVVKRTRSLSPGGTHAVPSEVLRSVRYAIRSRDNELQQLQRKLKNAELQVSELVTRFESADETRKRLEKQLADSKREISIREKTIEDATREVRRLEDRLRATESDKAIVESARMRLEEEIRRLKLVIDQTVADGERKALEEAETQRRIVEEEYKTRITELLHRVDALQDENKRLKGDANNVKDKFRNLENDFNSTLRKLDEKDVTIKHLEDLKADLLKDLESQRARFDAVTSEFDNLQAHYDTTTKNTVAIEMTVKEIKQQRDEISKQKDDLSRQLTDLMHKMELEMKKREDIEKASIRQVAEIEKLKTEIADYESQLTMLRRHNDELDTQLKTGQAKITTLENSVASAQKEIVKLNEINNKLQNEKQDFMNAKQNADATIDTLKEKIRKLEQEIEKLKGENKMLEEKEEEAKVAYKEEVNKVHALERELQEAKLEIDDLRKKLSQLDEANKERLELVLSTKAPESDVYERTEITEVRVKELIDKHKIDVERLENDRDDLVRCLRLLEDEVAEKQRVIDRQQVEIDEMRRQYETEIDRLKTEMANLETKYQNEVEDERDQHNREIEALHAAEDDLREKIALLEKKLEEALSKERLLQNEITDWEEKYDALSREVQKLQDQMETVRVDAEKEIQRWKTEAYTAQAEVKNLEATNETLRSQLASANDRITSLNKTINEQAAKMRELNSHVRRLEEELADAKAASDAFEVDLESAISRLHTIEEQFAAVQIDNNKLRAEIDALSRQIDVLKNTNATNDSEIERLKKKVVQLTAINKEQNEELDNLRSERGRLDKAYREKAKQVDQLNDAVKVLESRMERMHQEIQTLNEKLIAAETERNTLRGEVAKLEKELQLVTDQMKRKSDDFNAALEDLSNAHRASEDGRVNALQELETRKFEISDLQSRLDNAEQRLAILQQEYLNVDKERDMLQDSLRRFQSIISRSVVVEGPIDVQSIDVYVQKLLTRCEKLERERNEYRDSLSRMQRKAGDSSLAVINEHETLYRSIEERMADAENGKRSAEVKLASAKELLRSQEEALRLRDEERRTMKSKIVAFELESRGKEAQIRHLNELVKSLQMDLQNAQNDNRALRDREEKWDSTKVHTIRERDGDEQRIKLLISTFEAEREKLNDELKQLSSKLQVSESKNADLRDDADRLKRDLIKAEGIEAEFRRNLDEQTRLACEGQRLRDQLLMAQSDLANANNRKQQLESELMSVRSELRDQQQRLADASSRFSDLERQLHNSNNDKNRLHDKINELEKTIASQRNTENDLRHQLSIVTSERKALQNELDELRRRIAHCENDKKTTHEKVEELTKIRVMLVKKIETLEVEKRNADALISETASQREAIERSLNALERENKELNRNCTQLQQQIAQLEMDNGNRLIKLTNKQKEDHERFVQSIKAEKAQVERIVESRDRAQKNRIRQLESQLNMLREQLSSERLRRRDVVFTDVSKIGATTLGLSTGLEAPIYPQTSSLDYIIGNRGAFPSYYYSLPTNYLPTSSDVYKTTSRSITLREPVDIETSRESYTTSFHMSSIGGAVGASGVTRSLLDQRRSMSPEQGDSGERRRYDAQALRGESASRESTESGQRRRLHHAQNSFKNLTLAAEEGLSETALRKEPKKCCEFCAENFQDCEFALARMACRSKLRWHNKRLQSLSRYVRTNSEPHPNIVDKIAEFPRRFHLHKNRINTSVIADRLFEILHPSKVAK